MHIFEYSLAEVTSRQRLFSAVGSILSLKLLANAGLKFRI